MRIFCEAYNSACVGPHALPPLSCVGARRSRCRVLAALCAGPQRAVSGPSALGVGPRRSLCRGLALSASGPGPALSVGTGALCVRSLICVGPPPTHPVRGPPAPILVPPIQPGAFPFPGENPKPSVWGIAIIWIYI